MNRYPRIVAAVFDEPWAILPSKMEAIVEFIQAQADGVKFNAEELAARLSNSKVAATARRAGAIQVIPVQGVIAHRMNMMTAMSGGTSTQVLGAQIREAVADDSIKAVVLDVDSPGGAVAGTDELAAEIAALRGRKPIIASVSGMAASAAYWIASAADEVVASPTSQVGGIGVLLPHVDRSGEEAASGVKTTLITAGKYKAEGNPYEPLSDEARGALQAMVDHYYAMFVDRVAVNRGVSSKDVRGGFGEGRVVTAAAAKREGMIDRVETMRETLARLGVSAGPSRAVRANDERPEVQALAIERLRREVDLSEM